MKFGFIGVGLIGEVLARKSKAAGHEVKIKHSRPCQFADQSEFVHVWRNTRNTGNINYCANHRLFPQVEVIKADAINDTWKKVVNKQARYRYIIDAATF